MKNYCVAVWAYDSKIESEGIRYFYVRAISHENAVTKTGRWLAENWDIFGYENPRYNNIGDPYDGVKIQDKQGRCIAYLPVEEVVDEDSCKMTYFDNHKGRYGGKNWSYSAGRFDDLQERIQGAMPYDKITPMYISMMRCFFHSSIVLSCNTIDDRDSKY